jgi:large conductance mechanosensitive channel
MKIIQEFRTFISRGNVIDLAVGVIIGAAFGKIVSSLVSDVIMPPVGMLMSNVNFSNLFLTLNGQTYESLARAKDAGAPVIAYGVFLNTLIEFLIVAACVFALVKVINKIHREAPKPEAEVPRSDVLLEEIRDLLKQKP